MMSRYDLVTREKCRSFDSEQIAPTVQEVGTTIDLDMDENRLVSN